MDTISVRLLERKFYKQKLETSTLRFDILVLELEALTYQLDYEKKRNRDLSLIVTQKDFQIKTLKEQRTLDKLSKPTFINQVGKYGVFALIGFLAGVLLTL